MKRREFQISQDAAATFDQWHDQWENICEQHPHDPLIGGKEIYYNCMNMYMYVCSSYPMTDSKHLSHQLSGLSVLKYSLDPL